MSPITKIDLETGETINEKADPKNEINNGDQSRLQQENFPPTGTTSEYQPPQIDHRKNIGAILAYYDRLQRRSPEQSVNEGQVGHA